MKEKDQFCRYVDDNTGAPLGIITERDLVTKVCVNDIDNIKKILAEQLMSAPLITITRTLRHLMQPN